MKAKLCRKKFLSSKRLAFVGENFNFIGNRSIKRNIYSETLSFRRLIALDCTKLQNSLPKKKMFAFCLENVNQNLLAKFQFKKFEEFLHNP